MRPPFGLEKPTLQSPYRVETPLDLSKPNHAAVRKVVLTYPNKFPTNHPHNCPHNAAFS